MSEEKVDGGVTALFVKRRHIAVVSDGNMRSREAILRMEILQNAYTPEDNGQ